MIESCHMMLYGTEFVMFCFGFFWQSAAEKKTMWDSYNFSKLLPFLIPQGHLTLHMS